MPRVFKQLFVALVYLMIIFLIVYGIFSATETAQTCSDGIQNQEEQGVDCGVVCGNLCAPVIIPLSAKPVQLLKTSAGFDVVTSILNSNALYGSGDVGYEISYLDRSGQVVKTTKDTTYILPNQLKLIVHQKIQLPDTVVRATLKVTDTLWGSVDPSAPPIDFIVKREDYKATATSILYSAVLLNNSDFDFGDVDVTVILTDDIGAILAANTTDIQTFLGRSEREFSVNWPLITFVKNPKIIVQGTTNIFQNDNFLRQYGTQQKFQQYY